MVITTYNRADKVSDAIDSALTWVGDDSRCQVIVVDDCSTDETAEKLVSRYGTEMVTGRIRLVANSENVGVSGAKNAGFRASSGDWVIFLDSDDVFQPDNIREMMMVLERSRDVPIVFFRCVDQDGRFIGQLFESDMLIDLRTYLKHVSYGEALVCLNRRIVRNAPFFDELRGYEGLGCADIISRHGPALLSPVVGRIYNTMGPDRLSAVRGFMQRMTLVGKGHSLMLARFGSYMPVRLRAAYLLKSLVYWVVGHGYRIIVEGRV